MTKEFLRMKLSDLVPYENNPRHNEEAVDATIASMQQCGNIDPIEVDENNVILSGHTRRLALMKMGYEESDVVRVSGLTDLQKKKYRILANKTNEFAGWDYDLLNMELDGLDFEGFDFGFGGLDAAEDTAAEEPKESMADKYLVPPFSVIYGNKPDWLARKRAWVNRGLRSELGRWGGLAFNSRSNPETNFVHEPGGGRTKQGIQEQQQIKQLHDRSQELSTNTIAYMNSGKRIHGKQQAKAYADGLIEKREQIRKGKYGAVVLK